MGISFSTNSAVPGDKIDVSISPGAIALQRTPCGPKSCAISRVSEASAAFEVAYATPANGCTLLPAIEVTFTTLPCAALSSSKSPRASNAVANRFTLNTFCQVAKSVANTPMRFPPGSFGEIPALFTSANNLPPDSGSATFARICAMVLS